MNCARVWGAAGFYPNTLNPRCREPANGSRGGKPACVLPDRSQVTMTTRFLRSYSLLLIDTCHRRGIHAMGGMAAQIPIRDDPEANEHSMPPGSPPTLRESCLGSAASGFALNRRCQRDRETP